MGDLTGKDAAKKARRQQEGDLAKQRQIEKARLSEEEGEISRRRALAKGRGAGRSLLIKTSQTGQNSTLGV